MDEADAEKYRELVKPFLQLSHDPSLMPQETRNAFVAATGCGCAKPMRQHRILMRCVEGWHLLLMNEDYYVEMVMGEYDRDTVDPDPARREKELAGARQMATHYRRTWWATRPCPESMNRWAGEAHAVKASKPQGGRGHKLHV